MLKKILLNVLLLAFCVGIAALAWGMLRVLGDWTFSFMQVIAFASLMQGRKPMFGTKERFRDEAKIFLAACAITVALTWTLFQALGRWAFLLMFVITIIILIVERRKPKFGVQEPLMYEGQRDFTVASVHPMLNHILILSGCIALLGLIGLRIVDP